MLITNQPTIQTTTISTVKQANPLSSWYILPIENDVELGEYAGQFVCPIEIKTMPVLEDGFLNVKFNFKLAGEYSLPKTALLCNVSFMGNVAKNVPVILTKTVSTSIPYIYTYEGEVKLNISQTLMSNKINNQIQELTIEPFFNDAITSSNEIYIGGGKLDQFNFELRSKCKFNSYFKISNYYTQEELTEENFNSWRPVDYYFNHKKPIKPVIKNIVKPNYYFEPVSNFNNITTPLISPWKTNARYSPEKEFTQAKIILTYQVYNQPEKVITYDYNLPNLSNKPEFNLGFKTIYDFNKHEIKIVSNANSNGIEGIYFPEETIFTLQYVFKDKRNNYCFYTGAINGNFTDDFIRNIENEIKINSLSNDASGKWYTFNQQ